MQLWNRLGVLMARWKVRERLLHYGAWPVCAVWLLALCVAQATSLGEFVDVSLTHPFLFKARELLHQDPPLHPRLKILSYDDGSVDRLQRADLTIDDWATVLAGISARKPRAIYIDKVFSILFDPGHQREEALARLAAVKTPIVVGAFAVDQQKRFRQPLDLSGPTYRTASLVTSPDEPLPRFEGYEGWHVYGPHPDLRPLFAGVGHIIYPTSGLVSAFLQISADVVVPHMTLTLEKREYAGGRLLVDGIEVPLDARGRMVVNFSREDAYFTRHKTLGTAVLQARRGEPITYVDEGDTVLVLPEMFTGSTDFKPTPIGLEPAGLVLASVLNSLLSGAWISFLPVPKLQLLAFCLLGAFWGGRKSLVYWLGLVGLTAVIVATGVYLFAYQSALVPLPLQTAAFWGTSLLIFADRNLKREKEARRIAEELNDAAEIAKAFRPDDAPAWGFVDIAAFHRCFSEASGDWYAFAASPGGRFHHFVLCDVTGHGVQAALMVSICKTVLARYTRDAREALDQATFLETYARELNSMLFHHGRGRHLCTMLGITFDAATGEARVISAGHPAPIVCRPTAAGERGFKQVVLRSTILGLAEELVPKVATQKLAPGDELIAYTDGLPLEHQVRAFRQFLKADEGRFEETPHRLLKALWDSETRKTGRTLNDDVSIVWFRVRKRLNVDTEPETEVATG